MSAEFAPQTCIRSIRKDRNHDAVMRIGGEAPRRRAHSKSRLKDHVQCRVAATSVHYPQLAMKATEMRKFRCKVLTPVGGPDLPASRRW
jgi:hypothetical protein